MSDLNLELEERARSLFNGKSRSSGKFGGDIGGMFSPEGAEFIENIISDTARKMNISHREAAALIIYDWGKDVGDFWDPEKHDWYEPIRLGAEESRSIFDADQHAKAIFLGSRLEKANRPEDEIREIVEKRYPGHAYTPSSQSSSVVPTSQLKSMDDLDLHTLTLCNIFRTSGKKQLKGAFIAKKWYSYIEGGEEVTTSNRTRKLLESRFSHVVDKIEGTAGYWTLKPQYVRLLDDADRSDDLVDMIEEVDISD